MRRVCAIALGMSMAILPFAPALAIAQDGGGSKDIALNSSDLNQQARHLLDVALKSNGLIAPDVKPWHLKVDFRLPLNFKDGPKSFIGSMEEWSAAPYRWRRTYKSEWPSWNGSEWSVSKVDRFAKKDGQKELEDYSLMFHIVRPLIDPLFQTANIKPTDELIVRKVDVGNLALSCVSLSAKSAAERGKKPEWLVPMMCFDGEAHLRLIRSEETLLRFNDIQTLDGRAVARDIAVTQPGQAPVEIKVTLLEPIGSLDEGLLKPPPDAASRPYVIERGMPKPVSVYEVGARLPSMPNGMPRISNLLVPVFIQKDGTVRLQREVGDDNPLAATFKAVYKAVAKWKFQPYLVDGQPVEADYYVPYAIDDKPFVPSYQRTPASGDDVAGSHPGL
jgi:hypothetical protein